VNWLERTELLLGKEKLDCLKKSDVLIVGLGGVGAFAAEMICRAGVGNMTIADSDLVEHGNRNRQITALVSTTGQYKADVLSKRLLDINPDLNLKIVKDFIRDEIAGDLLDSRQYDYVVDAIDTLSPKVFLIAHCLKRNLKVVSSMGSGGKTDPTQVKIADISESYKCKLARIVRKRLSGLGIKSGFKVVFSTENSIEGSVRTEESQNKKTIVGTISFIPPLFGCFMAAVVINDLCDLQYV